MKVKLFFSMVFIFCLAALTKIVYDQAIRPKEFTLDTVQAILTEFGPMVLAIAAIALIISAFIATVWRWAYPIRSAFAMNILDQWIAKMERPAREEAKAEGVQLGIDWATRKAEAEAKGLPFDEPRPGSTPEEPPQ